MSTQLYPEVCNSKRCPVPSGHITTGKGICNSNCSYWTLRQETIDSFLKGE